MVYKTCHCFLTVKWLLTNVWLTINVPFMNDYYLSPTFWKSVHLLSSFSSRNVKHLSLLSISNMRNCSSNHSKLNMFEFGTVCGSQCALYFKVLPDFCRYLQMNSLCVDNDSSSVSDTGVTVAFHRSHIHKYLFLFWTNNNNNVNCTLMRLSRGIARLKVVMIMFLFSWEEKHEGPRNIQRAGEWQGGESVWWRTQVFCHDEGDILIWWVIELSCFTESGGQSQRPQTYQWARHKKARWQGAIKQGSNQTSEQYQSVLCVCVCACP